MKETTLCHPIVNGELLLIRKQRGLGEGKIVGAGGKIENGEAPREAARREVREELRVDPIGIEKRGEIEFHFGDDATNEDSLFVHIFTAEGIEGEPSSTDEATPEWHAATDLPYDEMWVDDRIWMPHLLEGSSFSGEFVLSEDGESLYRYEMDLECEFE